MKTFTVGLMLMFLASINGESVSHENQHKMIMDITKNCMGKVGATDDDVAKLIMLQPPENQAQKCLISCVMTTIGIVSSQIQTDFLRVYK